MVSIEEREKLAEMLLPRYTADVNKVLKAKKINPDRPQPFSGAFIINVFQGRYENYDIEAAFYEVYEARKAKADELEWKKNRLNSDKVPA